MILFIKRYPKKYLALLLSFSIAVSGMEIVTAAGLQTATNSTIPISSAAELAKIGTDSAYPMNGDYVLRADIDLSGMEWTPIGGYMGPKGTIDTSQPNVFSGTFDGAGHVISGMTIDLSGTITGDDYYAQVGLFSVIAGNSANDYAKVHNLIFTNVTINTDFTNKYASVGTLAGDVNGYSQIDQVLVLNGEINVNPSGICDTVGAGGIIGECRTGDTTVGNNNISITNCYNGASVSSNGTSDFAYAGGIIGRIAKSACKNVSNCINVAPVQYRGDSAFGICPSEHYNETYISTVSNCYFIDGCKMRTVGSEARAMSKNNLLNGTLPAGFSSEIWTARKNCYVVPSICYESSAADLMYLSGLSLEFAPGESMNNFKTTVNLPSAVFGVNLTWTSSNEAAITITNGQATAHSDQIASNTTVELTATTSSGLHIIYKVTVISTNKKRAVFDSDYAKAGKPLVVSVRNAPKNETFTYEWTVGGNTISNTTNTYTPTTADLEKFITVKVNSTSSKLSLEASTYFSELPVVYINTADGLSIDSDTVYKDAYFKLQGNDEFNNSAYFYDGLTQIKGRGNSTWWSSANLKRPYKLKLDKKTDLLGIGNGSNKHWVLLANITDHTNMRNELVSDLAKELGLEAMSTTNVVLILNGSYVGNYELCEHVRIGENRVNIFDWENYAETVANAICEHNPLDADTLTAAMETDFSWIDGKFTFEGATYNITDYIALPKFTGGFMLDMDFRSSNKYSSTKYVSPFSSSNGIPLFVNTPEYAKTSNTMMNYIKGFINAYEDALGNENHTTTYNGETVHYTDLFDMDSLVSYWFICEYTNNWDSMKNSTYMYKDLNEKAKMGPVWDYDWALGNINMYGITNVFVTDKWHTTLTGISTSDGGFREQEYQAKQWNRFLVTDPYFVTKAYELYKQIRPTILEDVIKDGGKIDTLETKYQSASAANDAKWSHTYNDYSGFAFINGEAEYTKSQLFNPAVESLKTFITKRVDWFDIQFTDVKNLYKSLGNTVSNKITVTHALDENDTVIATASVTDSRITNVEFIINGASLGVVPVSAGKAMVTISDRYLEIKKGALNTLQVLALDSSDNYIINTTNFTNFTKEVSLPLPDEDAPTQDPTDTPASSPTPTPVPDSPTPIPGNNSDVIKPQPTSQPNQSVLPDTNKATVKPSIKIKGKSSVKRRKTLTLKVRLLGLKKNIKVSLTKKSKKLLKIKKVTNKKIILKALNKKGKAKITVKCGKYKKVKTIKVK